MKRPVGLCLSLVFALALAAVAEEKSPLKLVATTPLPGFSGDFDHFALDLKGKRLFLTAEDHKTVDVFDLDGKHIRSITGFGQPHAALFLPESNNLIVTDGDDDFGRVELVSGENYKILNTIRLPNGVDSAVFDPTTQYYYVASGGEESAKTHLLTIIDTKTFTQVGEITLPGNESESMAVDKAGKKMYVSLRATNEVGVVDLEARKVVARWPIPGATTANSLVLDEVNHRVFIATRKPPKLLVFDTAAGEVVTSLPCAPLHDDMWFDTTRKRIYVTGSETTSVFEQKDADHYTHVADVPTAFRAKTSILVPELNRLYIAVSGKGKPDAKLALQVYDIQP
ncbi:MAG TPA: YncE family protein [Candidatus Udaeobacter sp.]|jgi:DNA-binding beta-propeller fold protein YncE|nr:YncE family protein [Candidatus Udaeobacter sp.]